MDKELKKEILIACLALIALIISAQIIPMIIGIIILNTTLTQNGATGVSAGAVAVTTGIGLHAAVTHGLVPSVIVIAGHAISTTTIASGLIVLGAVCIGIGIIAV